MVKETFLQYGKSLSFGQMATFACLVMLVTVAAAYGPTAQNQLGVDLKRLVHFIGYSSLLAGMLLMAANGRIIRTLLSLLIIADLLTRTTYADHLSIAVWMSVFYASAYEINSYITENLMVTAASVVTFVGMVSLPKVAVPKQISIVLLTVGLLHAFAPLVSDQTLSRDFAEDVAASRKAELKYSALGFDRSTAKVFHYADSMGYRLPISESLTGLAKAILYVTSDNTSGKNWTNVNQALSAPSLLVLVIGESLRADHLGLYGYHRDTTPRLRARGTRLQMAEQAYAGGANTWTAIPAMLTKGGSKVDFSLSIVKLAQAAGYQVHWLSNQIRFDDWGVGVSHVAQDADIQEFIATDSENHPLDEALLPLLQQTLDKKASDQKTLVILHMIGSHFLFNERYPADFARFSAATFTSEKQATIAAYDDSVRYTDYFLDEVIQRIEPYDGELMFVADHGLIDVASELFLKHDIRTPPAMQSLRVPLLYYGEQNSFFENTKTYNLFKFECLMAKWAMISANELRENDHCVQTNEANTVTFFDAKLNLRTETVEKSTKKPAK